MRLYGRTDRVKADILLILSYDEKMVPVVTAGSAPRLGTQLPEVGLHSRSSTTSIFTLWTAKPETLSGQRSPR
jgi:hypothetical protein